MLRYQCEQTDRSDEGAGWPGSKEMSGKDATTLLSLLAQGVRNVRLGATRAAFLTSALVSVTVESFGVLSIADAKAHVRASRARPA